MIISRKRFQRALEQEYQRGYNEAFREADHGNLHRHIDRSLDDLDRRLRKIEKQLTPIEGSGKESGGNTLPI